MWTNEKWTNEKWINLVGRVFNTRPRIGVAKDTVWLPRTKATVRFAEASQRPGAHVCLHGPTGAGKTSLALTHLIRTDIPYASVQVTESMTWSDFCRLLIGKTTNNETSLSGELEIGIDKALPVLKLRVGLADKHRLSDDATAMTSLATTWTEHDVAENMCRLNATLLVDDVERASDGLIARLADLCKLLTQSYIQQNAKLVLIGSGDVYQKLYRHNPALEERLLDVRLGAFRYPSDSWKFMMLGFEKLKLRHPGNSRFPDQQKLSPVCKDAVWEAADGLPKSVNRLGQEIALRAGNKKGINADDILRASKDMSEEHWIEHGQQFPRVLDLLERDLVARSVIKYFYEVGIGRVHQSPDIVRRLEADATRSGCSSSSKRIEQAIDDLVSVDFLVRTGKSGEIVFAKHPTAAHTLGVVMRDPSRFRPISEVRREVLAKAFPQQSEEARGDEDPLYDDA